MEITGLGPATQKTLWQKRVADTSLISSGLVAFQLQGFYAFSKKANDKETIRKLKNKVAFLVTDAPALQSSENDHAPLQEIKLHNVLKLAEGAQGKDIQVLALCGKTWCDRRLRR